MPEQQKQQNIVLIIIPSTTKLWNNNTKTKKNTKKKLKYLRKSLTKHLNVSIYNSCIRQKGMYIYQESEGALAAWTNIESNIISLITAHVHNVYSESEGAVHLSFFAPILLDPMGIWVYSFNSHGHSIATE